MTINLPSPERNPDFITNPMNPTIKEAWLQALRGRKYQQTTGTLFDAGPESMGFCCLGVLCDLAVKAGIIQAPTIISNFAHYGVEGDISSSVLPKVVMKWAGMESPNPDVLYTYDEGCNCEYDQGCNAEPPEDCPNDPNYRDLADINDNHASFEEIAALIEEQL